MFNGRTPSQCENQERDTPSLPASLYTLTVPSEVATAVVTKVNLLCFSKTGGIVTQFVYHFDFYRTTEETVKKI